MTRPIGGFVPVAHLTDAANVCEAEVRVARLIAYMRPYLPSAAVSATQPMRAIIPTQRRATHPAERRLDDIADARAREVRSRHLREVPRARTFRR